MPVITLTRDEVLEDVQDIDALRAFARNQHDDIYRMRFDDLRSLIEDFEEAYNGEWPSFEDFARNLAEDIGAMSWHDLTLVSLGGTDSPTAWPYSCIDWEHAANELRHDYWAADVHGGGVFVFRSI